MDFEPTPEQKDFSEKARRFAEEVIKPRAAEMDASGAHSVEIIRRLGDLQMMGVVALPEEGGCGKGQVGYILALIEITKVCASVGAAMFVNNSLYAHPLLLFGNEEQKSRYLRPCVAGRGTGSAPLRDCFGEAGDFHMHARGSGEGWMISGREVLIGNGVLSSHCVLPVVTGEDSAMRGITLFVIDLANSDGLQLDPLDACGGRECAVLFAKDASLPPEALLGNEGNGLDHLLKIRPASWIGLSAHAVGIGRGVLDSALEYSLRKKRFGKEVLSSQAVQWILADMTMELDAAELLTLQAGWLADQGKSFEKQAAMAKLYASDAAMKAADHGAQIMGEDHIANRTFFDWMIRAKRCQIGQQSNLRIKGLVAGHLVGDLKGIT